MRVLFLLAVLALFGCATEADFEERKRAQEFTRYEWCVHAYRDNKTVKTSAMEIHEVCMQVSGPGP